MLQGFLVIREHSTMPDVMKIVGHALLAGVFFFGFQRFVMAADLQTSAMWAIFAAIGAAALAYSQSRRGR